MSYQGNPSLAQDVQERISNTFQQTLDLVTGERDQEALVGCEFILRMDPDFQPAKTLVARLKSEQRPVLLDDLKTLPAGGPPAANAEIHDLTDLADLADLEDLDDLGSLDDLGDLESLGDLDDAAPAAPAPTAPAPVAPVPASPAAPVTGGLGTVLSDLLANRNFQQILQIAETQKQAIASDPAVAALVEKAQGLAESGTYVQAFLKSARQARAEGRVEEAEAHLKKARSLDPEHPDIQDFVSSAPLRGDISSVAIGAPPPAAPSSPAAPPQPAAPPDDGLMALQEQSLSLEAAETDASAALLAEKIARDPRQTKPMPALPVADVAPSAPEAPGEDLADDLFDNEATDAAVGDLDAELFDAEGEVAEPLMDDLDDDLGEDLGAKLFDDDKPEALPDPVTELTLDDLGAPEVEAPEVVAPAEGGDRVGQLIAEGQDAFDRGEYQGAIDVWSRIFLVDIDNTDASRLIEEARNKKAELERQAEELFHEAVGQIESQSTNEAKGTLASVLELAPSHSLAREYLEQLEAGQVPAISGGDLEVTLGADDDIDLGEGAGVEAGSPSLEAAVARDRVVVVKGTDKRIIALGAAVLLAILGTGAFLVLKWDDWFPNQEPPPKMTQQTRKVDPIERATKMHEGGNTENAILMLERIQPQDPIYEDAQALIAQWKALVEAPPEPEETGPSAEQTERHGLLLGAAREAHKQGRQIRARKYFERASKILPLGPEDQTLKAETDRRLEFLEDQIKLFGQGQYTAIIPVLWRKHDVEPDNLDIERLLIDSYYNLALTDLQRGNTQAAAKKLREALEVQPDNQELQRLQLFAKTYTQRRQDLLYRIFVKYLPSR